MITSYGSNQAISGQTHSVSFSRLFKTSSPVRGVIQCPGAGSTSLSYLVNFDLMDAIVKSGRPLASFPHGNLFGNSTAVGYVANIRTYGQSNWGFASGKVDLMGGSAGAAAALNFAKANPTLVNAIALIIPGVDLQDIDTNNRGGFSAAIQTAYGGAVPDASNPADNTASFTGFPIKIWYSTDDPVVLPEIVTTFASAVGADIQSLGAIGHANTSINPQQVVDFFNAH